MSLRWAQQRQQATESAAKRETLEFYIAMLEEAAAKLGDESAN
jgi:hypothetical protein